jgi:beta-lactamase class A
MTLASDIQAVIAAAGIEAGISVWHIESGEKTDVNGDELFPMASVFKIPILATAGQQIAAGKLSLDQRITLKDSDKSLGSGILPFFEAGISPTFRDLLTLMIIISDNTATDMNVELLGGAAVVENAMHALGLQDIYFKFNCKDLLRLLFPPEVRDLPRDEIEKWEDANGIDRKSVVLARTPENNVSTAKAMTELVYRLWQGEIVSGTVKDELIEILLKQQLNQRLPRFLQSNVRVAHKTGTISGTCNDSGVIYISDTNHAVVTAFTSWDDLAVWKQPEARYQRVFEVESAIGNIGKLVYNYYNR